MGFHAKAQSAAEGAKKAKMSKVEGKMKTKVTAGLLIMMAALMLFGLACNRQSKNGKRVIAVIPKGTSHFFLQSVHAGAEAAAKEEGVQIMCKGPEHEIAYTP